MALIWWFTSQKGLKCNEINELYLYPNLYPHLYPTCTSLYLCIYLIWANRGILRKVLRKARYGFVRDARQRVDGK